MSPSHDEIRLALERIGSSEQFRQSERLRSFLNYIVIETLEGRADRIKAYSVGLEVFGRRHDEDASNDGIVRTTAIRLRDALDKYYRSDGVNDELRITLPKGRYIPEFVRSSSGPTVEMSQSVNISLTSASPRWKTWAMIGAAMAAIGVAGVATYQVLKAPPWAERDNNIYVIVENGADDGKGSGLKASFSNHLTEKLVGIGAARIIGPVSGNRADRDRQLASIQSADVMVLSEALTVTDAGIVANWRLSDARSDVVLWAGEAQTGQGGAEGVAQLADIIAFKVLGTEGAVSLLKARLGSALAGGAGNCVPQSQRLAIIFDEVYQTELLACLEDAVEKNPNLGEVWALLSQLYYFISETESSLGRDGAGLAQQASVAAQRAYELSPSSFLTHQAQLFVAYRTGDVAQFNEIADRMIEQYPGDPNLKIRIGARLVQLGFFQKGRQLINTAIAAKESANPWDYMPLALASIGEGEYEDAVALTARAELAPTYLVPLLRMIALTELGRMDEAGIERDKVLALRPNYGAYFYGDARGRGLDASLIDRMAASLDKAGIAVTVP